MMTNAWKNIILKRAYKSSPTETAPTYFCLGADATTPTVLDSYLIKPLPKTATSIDTCDAITGWSNENDAGAVSLNETIGDYKEGTGCLDLPLTFSSGTAGWYKTIGSTNLTSQYIYVWFYVEEKATYLSSSGGVKIILGTGGFTDYNIYQTDYADITDGWNLIVFSVNDYTSQGGSGATIATIDRIKLEIDCIADATGNNIRMDYWHYASLSSQSIDIVAGYPTFNVVNQTVSLRGLIGTSEMNGYVIKEVGLRNADSSFVLIDREIVTPSITKSAKVRITILHTDEVI